MSYITLPEGLPGILGPLAFRPETAKPLCDLANALLRAPGSLTPGEREMIAARVSGLNQCAFCCASHSAIAAGQLGGHEALVESVVRDPELAEVSPKLKALLAIASQVQAGGTHVRPEHIARARAAGATDVEIHDTVLIAAAFCMYNRYVDGLATWAPTDPASYRETARLIVEHGYGARP